ncbi:MAG: molybdopterin oxidoreductase family protein [Alphaproteobacteria bacterium]|nr:molybdopterin oxidoreductase family protein [Alphaproteobacteria bacterium]
MNIHQPSGRNIKTGRSVCPHDCPSACALEVELLDERTIGRVRGAKDNSYTRGVICEKVARYSERVHHPERLLHPMKRVGPKGAGQFERISWDEALDLTAAAFLKAEAEHGAESVWPYYYAGTMGLLMRDGIERLTNVKGYSTMYGTVCIALSWPGFFAGTGRIAGVDPREMQKSDLIIVWGGNPVNTQVNVMTHVGIARKERGAKLACVDIYETGTMKQADIKLLIRPGTDGALACGVMHVLFRDGYADWDYLRQYTDDPEGMEANLAEKTPEWAAEICGCPASEIVAFAELIGQTPRSFFRIGYGFARGRNGAANMHAVSCIPAITGAWKHEGGGALHSNSGIYKWNRRLLEAQDANRRQRVMDQARVGEVLCGNPQDLRGGPKVAAMLIQNTNPVSIAPDQTRVKEGFAREDLFVCVHEQFITDTAKYADVLLPATMFLEHDDIYQGGGHSHILWGGKLIEPPGEARSNDFVIRELARRVGARHESFERSGNELIDDILRRSGRKGLDQLEEENWFDIQPDFATAHFLKGFGHADGKFHFRADWKGAAKAMSKMGVLGPIENLPAWPGHYEAHEQADAAYPFRLATSPARTFLNSTFNETPGSRAREVRPSLLMHPDDLAALGASDGARLRVGSRRGEVVLHAKAFDGLRRGVVIAEGLWPNEAHEGGRGINTLTGADQPAPAGGGAYHDNAVWVKTAG